MLIVCPNCKKRFDLDPANLGASPKLRCSACKAVFRLVRKPAAVPSPAGDAAAAAPPPSEPRAEAMRPPADAAPGLSVSGGAGGDAISVVIANESAAFCEAVRKVLAAEQFQIFVCNDGKVALDTVSKVRPQVLLLDVALPTMFGFEVCERVRQNPELSGTRIVLIASIYDKTRYKRSPHSLYGADDYIEKHHIPDELVPMIYRLAGSPAAAKGSDAGEFAAQQEVRCQIRDVEERETMKEPAAAPEAEAALQQAPAEEPPAAEPPAAFAAFAAATPGELPEPEKKAKRLARIIVSDIVLYNQGKVEQGVREGNFYELLADDIREGERLYLQRVPEPVRANTSFLNDAFEELIAKKRAELRL